MSLLSIMLNSDGYTGYAGTHTGHVCIYATCMYYLLTNCICISKQCITYITYIFIRLSTSYNINICQEQAKRMHHVLRYTIFLRLNNYRNWIVITSFTSNVIIYKCQEISLYAIYKQKCIICIHIFKYHNSLSEWKKCTLVLYCIHYL